MRIALMLSFSLWGVSLPLHACSYDGQFNNPFKESFPGALDIAIATQNAVTEMQLSSLKPLEGAQGLRRASWWLTVMAKQNATALESVSYIYLVDSHLWSKVADGQKVEVHTSPTEGSEMRNAQVLLLSEAALQALVKEQVDLKQALELGVVQYAS